MSASPHPSAFLPLAERLADAAGKVARRYFRTPVAVDAKADESPVTIADREAESAIRAILKAEYPNHGIIGEEHGSHNPDAEYVWILDPIDGTKSFITGRPLFVTLIALLHKGKPVLGLIDQPIIKDRWIGAAGHPTTHNGQTVRTRPCPELKQATLGLTSPDMFTGENIAPLDQMRRATLRTVFGGDGYLYGLIASGFMDIGLEADMKLWDYAALVPVIEGAGGCMTDWQGQPLGLHSDGRVLAAGDPLIHAQALQVLADQPPVR